MSRRICLCASNLRSGVPIFFIRGGKVRVPSRRERKVRTPDRRLLCFRLSYEAPKLELSRSDLNASYKEFCEEIFLGLANSVSQNEKKKKKKKKKNRWYLAKSEVMHAVFVTKLDYYHEPSVNLIKSRLNVIDVNGLFLIPIVHVMLFLDVLKELKRTAATFICYVFD